METTKRNDPPGKAAGQPEPTEDQVQGEGDYVSARRYRRDVEQYVENADIDKAARAAAPRDAVEAAQLEAAEEAGRRRAKTPRALPPRQDEEETL